MRPVTGLLGQARRRLKNVLNVSKIRFGIKKYKNGEGAQITDLLQGHNPVSSVREGVVLENLGI